MKFYLSSYKLGNSIDQLLKFVPYGKSSKEQYFKIKDEYTLFYLQWIEPIGNNSIAIKANYWHTKYNQSYVRPLRSPDFRIEAPKIIFDCEQHQTTFVVPRSSLR